jgi:hypothetical protein
MPARSRVTVCYTVLPRPLAIVLERLMTVDLPVTPCYQSFSVSPDWRILDDYSQKESWSSYYGNYFANSQPDPPWQIKYLLTTANSTCSE